MYSGSVKGADGLSERTDAIHTSRSGFENGRARNSTAFTTENTATLAPIESASVIATAHVKLGRRRNWRSAAKMSFEIAPVAGPSRGTSYARDRVNLRPISARIRHGARSSATRAHARRIVKSGDSREDRSRDERVASLASRGALAA